MPEERNTGRLVAELVLDTSKARKEAEAVKKILDSDNIGAGIDIFTTALRTFDQVSPDVIGNISDIITQIEAVKQAFQSGANPALMWGNVIAAGAGAAFTLIFSLIEQMKQKQEEARKKDIQLTEEYDQTRESLQELTREYTSLKQTLDSGGLSYDEEIEAKKELLAIQEKLVEMFGSEANGLDLVNGKLEDQTDQIEKLSVAQAKKYLQDTFKSGQDAEKVLNEEVSYHLGSLQVTPYMTDFEKNLDRIMKSVSTDFYDINIGDKDTFSREFQLRINAGDAEDVLRRAFELVKQERDNAKSNGASDSEIKKYDDILFEILNKIQEATSDEILESKRIQNKIEYSEEVVATSGNDAFLRNMENQYNLVHNNIGAMQELASAYETLSSGQKLSTDSLIDLCDRYPELTAYIEETGDVSFQNGEIIANLHQKQRDAVIRDLEQQKAALEEKETLTDEEITLLKNVEETLIAYKASAADLQTLDLSAVSSELSNLGSVYATLHDGQELDLNTVLQMIDTYPEFAQAIADGSLCLSDQEAVVRSLFETKKNAALQSLELDRQDVISKRNATMETIQLLQKQLEAYKALYGGGAFGDIYGPLGEAQQKFEESSEKLNKINAQIAAIKGLSIDDYASSSGGARETASAPARNEALQQELQLLEHRKSLNQVSAQEEVAWLERINSTYSKNSDEQMDMEKRLYNARKAQQEAEERAAKEALDAAIKGIENKKALGKLTTEEEINQLQRIRQTYRMNAEDAMSLEIKLYNLKKNLQNEQTDKLDNIADGVIKALENKYERQKESETKRINQSIDSWKKWENETVTAIQGQIDALDELSKAQESEEQRQEYEQKRQAAALQLAYEKDDYNRKQLQKELNRLDKEEAKRLEAEAREKQKEELQKQMDKVKEESEKQQEMLKKRQEALNKQYEKLTSSFALEQEAQKIIMQQGMNGVINLINSYAPEFNLAGKSLADKLFEGFRSHNWDIDAYADYIQKGVSAAYAKAAGTAAKAAEEFWKSRIEYDRQTGMTTAPVKAPKINLTVNFNQPVESPVETQRRLQNVAQELARQIIK